MPVVKSISDDVTTVVNLAKDIYVTAETSDKGMLSYQWYVFKSKLEAGEAISSATENCFTPETKTVGTFYYYCVVTNSFVNSL